MMASGASSNSPRIPELTGKQLQDVIQAVDAVNAQDPFVIEVRGRSGPKELLHAEMVTEWVTTLDPQADASQLVAARAHHLRRWARPRSDYPEGRAGYRRWRRDAADAQAAEVASILSESTCGGEVIARVSAIITKKGLGEDPAVQTHEDALCLVFLETQLDELLDSLSSERAAQVLARTISKMSARAIELATTLPLSASGTAAVTQSMNAAKSEGRQ